MSIRHYFHHYQAQVPTGADFDAWVDGLPRPLGVICRLNGWQRVTGNLYFQRYVLEARGFSLYECLRDWLNADALALWLTSTDYGTSLHPNQLL